MEIIISNSRNYSLECIDAIAEYCKLYGTVSGNLISLIEQVGLWLLNECLSIYELSHQAFVLLS